MTTIAIPPDLEAPLSEQAQRRGTTVESLALETLRERFVRNPPPKSAESCRSLAEFLEGFIGVIGSGEHVSGGARMSENTGRQFTKGLLKKHRQGQP
jgi:hypothetical protein